VNTKVKKIVKEEKLLLTVGSLTTCAVVSFVDEKKKLMKLELNSPICAEWGQKCAISRQVGNHWRLVGWGKILSESVPLKISQK